MTTSPISVLLVDDHRVVSSGVRSYLESFPDVKVVGMVGSGEEALDRLDEWLPNVVVMDLLMPGGMDGIEATRRIRARSPRTQVVALTASTDEARLIAVLRAGAIGYVRKDADPERAWARLSRRKGPIGPALRPTSAYDPVRDFSPITLLMQAPQVLVVSAESPINSVKDLIAAAKRAGRTPAGCGR